MAHKNQPDRWESLILTASLAVAGTLFLFDRLGSLARVISSLPHSILHLSPVILAVTGVSLMLADMRTAANGKHSSGGRYE